MSTKADTEEWNISVEINATPVCHMLWAGTQASVIPENTVKNWLEKQGQ